MLTVYWVRHGENKANLTKEFSYKYVDYSLTAKGIRQVQQTAEFFRDKNIEAIYTSPLKRAVESAEIIARTLHLDFSIIEQFREINVGSLERQMPTAELWDLHDRILTDWICGKHDSTFPDGENYFTLLERMRAGFEEVMCHKSEGNILVVAHKSNIMATISALCRDVDMDALLHIENHYCSITELEFYPGDENIVGRLRCWASCSHLQEADFA